MTHMKKLLLATLTATCLSGVAIGAESGMGVEQLDPYIDSSSVASADTFGIGIESLDPFVESSGSARAEVVSG